MTILWWSRDIIHNIITQIQFSNYILVIEVYNIFRSSTGVPISSSKGICTGFIYHHLSNVSKFSLRRSLSFSGMISPITVPCNYSFSSIGCYFEKSSFFCYIKITICSFYSTLSISKPSCYCWKKNVVVSLVILINCCSSREVQRDFGICWSSFSNSCC